MATETFTGMTPVTMADWQSLVPDADISRKVFINTIRDYQPFWDRATIVRGNDGQGFKGTIVEKYPEGQLVGINEGWTGSAPTGRSVRYGSCIVRDRSIISKEQLDRMPAAEQSSYRLRRDQSFVRGLVRGQVKRVFQGNPNTNPRDCLGLANMVKPDVDGGIWNESIIDAGGTGSNLTSVWVIDWHPDEMTCFCPEQGQGAGIHVDVQKDWVYVPDAQGRMFPAYVTEFGYDLGVFCGNPNRIVRIANVDPKALTTNAKTGANLIKSLVEATHRLDTDDFSHVGIYCTKTVGLAYDLQMLETTKYTLVPKDFGGNRGSMLTFGGIPIYQYGTDVLSEDETKL